MSTLRFWLIGGSLIALTSLAGAAGLAWLKVRSQAVTPHHQVTPAATDRNLVLDLTDLAGERITAASLRGQPVLLYFGYTFCPDICPTELGFLHRVLDGLGEDAVKIRTYFITVDPERDTPEVLKDYVPHFDPRIGALNGDLAAIQATADSVGAVFSKTVPARAPEGFYLMNHSMAAFLIDGDGRPVATYRSAEGVDAVVADLRRRLEHR